MDEEISHVDGIRNVVSTLKMCNNDPIDILNRDTDLFGDILDKNDETTQKLQIGPTDPVLEEHMSNMVSACLVANITVLERQYERFLGMDLTDGLREQTMSARSHNIDAEEVMGMFSSGQRRSPNANHLLPLFMNESEKESNSGMAWIWKNKIS